MLNFLSFTTFTNLCFIQKLNSGNLQVSPTNTHVSAVVINFLGVIKDWLYDSLRHLYSLPKLYLQLWQWKPLTHDFYNSGTFLLPMKEGTIQVVFVSLRNKKFLCENFKCFFWGTSRMLICSNYYRVSTNITEIIVSFANFCRFYKIICVVWMIWFNWWNKYFCLIRENKCSSKANFLELPKNNK